MPGVLLFLPFLLIRFGLLAAKNRQALPRAAHFAPMQGREKIAYAVYQLATLGILLALCAGRIQTSSTGTWYGGLAVYLLGLVLCAVSVLHFAAPDQDGLNTQGIYRLSHVPGVFCLLPGDGPAHPVLGTAGPGVGVSGVRPLDHPGGGAVVPGDLRGSVSPV